MGSLELARAGWSLVGWVTGRKAKRRFGEQKVELGCGIFIRFLLHNDGKYATGSHKTRVGYENNDTVTKLVGHGSGIVQLRETK